VHYNFQIASLAISYLAILFLTSLWGVNFDKSFWGNPFREDGLITYFHLVALFFITILLHDRKLIKLFAKNIALSSFVLSIWVLTNFFKLYILGYQNIPNWNGAIIISFGNPNFLGGYLATTLPFLYISFSNNTKSVYFKVALISIFAAIIFTKSWSSIIVALVSLAAFFLIFLNKQKKKVLYSLVFVGTALAIFLTYLYQYNLETKKYIGNYMPEGRIRIITKAFLAIKQKPLFGWGLTNFDTAFSQIDWPMKWGHDLYVDKTHSGLLEVAVSSGLIGLGIYSLFIVKAVFSLAKVNTKIGKSILLVMVLYLLHSQTNIISINEELMFWTVLGWSAIKN